MKDFYIYIHRRLADDKVFYVGKGCGNRAWSRDRRNRHWLNVVAKHGYSVEIIESGLQSWYAYEREVDVIAKFREAGCNLTNRTDGGDGVIGYEYTDGHRAKLSEASKANWKCAEYREKISASLRISSKVSWENQEYRDKTVAAIRAASATDERSAAMSAANRATWQDEQVRQRRIDGIVAAKSTPESKLRHSAAQKTKWATGDAKQKLRESKRETMKPVVCVQTGVVFDAMMSAVRWLVDQGFPSATRSNIRSVCQGKMKSAYGYQWRFVHG